MKKTRTRHQQAHAALSLALTDYLMYLGEEQGITNHYEKFNYVQPIYNEVMDGIISREIEKAGLPYPDVSSYLLTVS
jgi:hypothetical protein